MSLGNIDRRLDKLEAAANLANGCPECGYVRGGPVQFVIHEHDPNVEPENCATCRFPISFTMNIGDVEFNELTDDDVDGN
jgi:hypothetical protein